MKAIRIETAPTLDGDVLNDSAWSSAQPATGFTQTTPDEGDPASEKTEVFVAFDDDNFYIGVVCYDRDLEGIIVKDSRRDASLADTDSLQLILDTYSDLQSAFLFGTNPAGMEYDGQVTRDGEVMVGSTGGFNLAWDGAWKVAAKIFDQGWAAEFAIPFRTLRFPKGGSPQTWGVNFERKIRRHKERAYWAALPRQFDVDRVSLAGRLEGVEVPRQQFLQATPYALGDSAKGRGGSSDTEEDFEVGIDLKYGITPSLALDVTLNTDFAEVEADVQQINLNRFNLFFPEKRSFFLENAGTFRVGLPGQVELFFSRRIGLENGQEVPIDGGLRLSGKTGRTNMGLLYMRTDDVGEMGTPENEFAVVRISRDVAENSSIGMIVTSREATGPLTGDDDDGHTFGVDGRWAISPKSELKGFVAKTDTPGVDRDDHAFYLGGRWNSEKLVAELSYAEVGEGFDPKVGFLTRSNYRRPEALALYRHRPEKGPFLAIRPHVFYQGFWDFDDFKESSVFHAGVDWEYRNGFQFQTGFNVVDDGVKTPFTIHQNAIIPADEYSRTEAQFRLFTNQAAPVSFQVLILAGEFFNGDRVSMTPILRFRRSEKLTGALAWRHDNVDLPPLENDPDRDFENDLGQLRLAYAFTPKLFVESLIQYNTNSDRWSSNVRFGWRESASTGLYVVYNDTQEIGAGNFVEQRQLIVKYSRLFDLWER